MTAVFLQSQVVRFAIVGTIVTSAYVVMYLGFRAVGIRPLLANGIAYTLGVCFQYFGQTLWTFKRTLNDMRQSGRYLTTISAGVLLSSLITAGIGPALAWADWVSAGVVVVLIPSMNFLVFKFWVYRSEGA